MPYILFDFQTNNYMNIGDREERGRDEYSNTIRKFILKHSTKLEGLNSERQF